MLSAITVTNAHDNNFGHQRDRSQNHQHDSKDRICRPSFVVVVKDTSQSPDNDDVRTERVASAELVQKQDVKKKPNDQVCCQDRQRYGTGVSWIHVGPVRQYDCEVDEGCYVGPGCIKSDAVLYRPANPPNLKQHQHTGCQYLQMSLHAVNVSTK